MCGCCRGCIHRCKTTTKSIADVDYVPGIERGRETFTDRFLYWRGTHLLLCLGCWVVAGILELIDAALGMKTMMDGIPEDLKQVMGRMVLAQQIAEFAGVGVSLIALYYCFESYQHSRPVQFGHSVTLLRRSWVINFGFPFVIYLGFPFALLFNKTLMDQKICTTALASYVRSGPYARDALVMAANHAGDGELAQVGTAAPPRHETELEGWQGAAWCTRRDWSVLLFGTPPSMPMALGFEVPSQGILPTAVHYMEGLTDSRCTEAPSAPLAMLEAASLPGVDGGAAAGAAGAAGTANPGLERHGVGPGATAGWAVGADGSLDARPPGGDAGRAGEASRPARRGRAAALLRRESGGAAAAAPLRASGLAEEQSAGERPEKRSKAEEDPAEEDPAGEPPKESSKTSKALKTAVCTAARTTGANREGVPQKLPQERGLGHLGRG
ncbi:unnamed protein product [Prorocentrum cordatum]|uniref:Transmembrane protein 175 n=1 Tax=Prorocentrum cordatum TaxID=2364126 RepID=A0ABN9PAU9_9DINO|nr:unnamed protein product [Polarella glacialis]